MRSKRGFNLIEAAIVLGVVGLVIGGIWVAAASVTQNRKLNQATSGVLVIIENTRRILSGNRPTGLTEYAAESSESPPVGYTMGLFDGADGFSYDAGSDEMKDPWGNGDIYLELNKSYAGTLAPIMIWFNYVDTKTCIKMVSTITSRFQDNSSLVGVGLPFDAGGSIITTVPLIPTAAQCTHANPVHRWVGFAFNY